MNEVNLRKACFNLAESLMWQKDSLTSEKIETNFNELSETANKLYEIALGNYYIIQNLPDSDQILIRAINYIKSGTIPPLRNNYPWFDYTLGALLELCNPESFLNKESLPFLDDLQKGIDEYRKSFK